MAREAPFQACVIPSNDIFAYLLSNNVSPGSDLESEPSKVGCECGVGVVVFLLLAPFPWPLPLEEPGVGLLGGVWLIVRQWTSGFFGWIGA